MDEKFKKIAPYLTIFIVIFFLIGSYVLYKSEARNIEKKVYNILSHNTYHFKEYFSISESFLYAMKYTIEDKFELGYSCVHPSYKDLIYKKDLNFYQIRDNRTSLMGIGNPKDFSAELINEQNSTLYLTPLFFSAKKIIPDMRRIYYKSANHFIFTSENLQYKDKKQFLSIYKKSSWERFIKNQNKYKNMIISNTYNEYLKKEHLLTLSLPVYKEKNFTGLVSIEKNLNTLTEYLKRVALSGRTYLVNGKDNIIVSKENSLLNTKLTDNSDIIKIPIVENQLYLTHVMDKYKLRKEAFYRSSGKILILLLLIVISIILIYLKVVLTKVQYLANTDALTKLLNRRAMKESIENQMKISRRYNQELSFLLIDIDYFKKVNDKYGHQTGDLVLTKVSDLFKHLIRGCDIAARYGGEEFLIALANTDINEAYLMAERVRKLANKIKIKGINLNLTVSIGCCSLKEEDDYESILRRVDKLMYKAKKRGRDNSVKEEID
ncbi:sensor domain-containing diguanylate cyclase [Halarcobacter anaerophilus]|uniref:sensor domain-containing diguanylate cyclase n=1 Tax=Halarcobacter anaerophilus TaxID=877500 RepID=UPI0005C8E417|nr:diguanylate cyclase [Halarcobacter anaerophilus]